MILYAIVDPESGLFVTRQNRLKEFGTDTKLFKTRTEAMRFIEAPIDKEFKSTWTLLQNDLAWDLLEKLYNKDRWHIDCSFQEVKDARNQFLKLKPMRIDLIYDI